MLDWIFYNFLLIFSLTNKVRFHIFSQKHSCASLILLPTARTKMHSDKAQCSRGQPNMCFKAKLFLTNWDFTLTLKYGVNFESTDFPRWVLCPSAGQNVLVTSKLRPKWATKNKYSLLNFTIKTMFWSWPKQLKPSRYKKGWKIFVMKKTAFLSGTSKIFGPSYFVTALTTYSKFSALLGC